MLKFIDDKLETKINSNLKNEQKIHVLITYNETTF